MSPKFNAPIKRKPVKRAEGDLYRSMVEIPEDIMSEFRELLDEQNLSSDFVLRKFWLNCVKGTIKVLKHKKMNFPDIYKWFEQYHMVIYDEIKRSEYFKHKKNKLRS